MAFTRLPRRRLRALPHEMNGEVFSIAIPQPDEPWVLRSFGDASAAAVAICELPVQREVLVLMDQFRQVTALVIDPPAHIGLLVGQCLAPVLDLPFCQTLVISCVDRIPSGPPTSDARAAYHALRRAHMMQGLQLIDIVLTDVERISSMAIACDTDPVWFDQVADRAA